MRVAVTGGSGFLGRSVVSALVAKGFDVLVIDNDWRGNSKLLDKKTTFIDCDIRDQEKFIKATRGANSIIHLAFINGTRHFYESPDLVIDVGIRGMLSVNEAVKQNKIEELILFSTSEVYQQPVTIPTSEDVSLTIPDILNPRYSYGGAKITCELITIHLTSNFLKSWKIIRPHNIYGPRMGNDHVIPELFNKVKENMDVLDIQGDGSQTRSFCNILDFESAISLILDSQETNQIYHVGVRDEVKIRKLAEMILEVCDKKLRIRETKPRQGETQRRCPDITKIENLGFEQKITLKEGLSEYLRSI